MQKVTTMHCINTHRRVNPQNVTFSTCDLHVYTHEWNEVVRTNESFSSEQSSPLEFIFNLYYFQSKLAQYDILNAVITK